jgi:hypothetical protein
MKIDRKIQLQILQKLADVYPSGIAHLRASLPEIDEEIDVITNVMYLAEHQLVHSGYEPRRSMADPKKTDWLEPGQTKITAKGMDFLLDDGGLGAILGVVTVKLDASSIKALLLKQIDQAKDVSHEEQSRLKSLVLTAGDQSIRKLVDTFVEAGLKAAPSSGQLIGMLQGLLA